MALHVSRAARVQLDLAGWEAFTGGKLHLADLGAARELHRRLVAAAKDGRSEVSAGELYALSRLEEVCQGRIARHLRERDPGALEGFLHRSQRALGVEETERLLTLFSRDFALPGSRDVLLRELLVWWALAENPAAAPATERLFAGPFRDDPGLARLRGAIEEPAAAPAAGDELFDQLRAPAVAAPESLADQLRFVLEEALDLEEIDRPALLRGLDLLAEEATRVSFAPGPGPVEVPAFSDLEGEPESYSPDRAWMPGVVLLAKNVFVWLDQLSRRFDRPIRRLDQIPDKALAEVAGWGFSGLWLIGVWERSAASERIKRLCGNPEAVASAYSLKAYRVAKALGGDEALDGLQRRALRHGIRLGADMVPNHLGLDSDWLLAHPDRFLSLPASPFGAYTFDGPDLSPDPAVGIYLEDHYFDRSDAAVVFKRVDRRRGETRYVYHGNDGTAMPWNDTAQLDYLNPETREAVVATILEVARRFPLIRFDAAMTLTRRHYQRLWFPPPGGGGAIPSRAERGLDRADFAERMPEEFWREVVDRVGREAPETLLLAEAFWLMEGYFVRSLGMHRVYNSAFMHMLRDGENGKYRRLIQETLAFDPRILKRYVNFLTNPDERTAIEQFGDGDRYFGSCVLLATLPGLPMFGHGQVEGLAEKYGMEYRRSYRAESADAALVARHEREIAPLLRRRADFAGVENFELYDFVDSNGAVVEDVLALSNGAGAGRTLIVFNNRDTPAVGTLRRAVARLGRPARPFAAAFGLDRDDAGFCVLTDRVSTRSYLRAVDDLRATGVAFELGPYSYRVFDRVRTVRDDADGRYRRLAERVGLAGIADLDRALADLALEPAAEALARLLERPVLARLEAAAGDDDLRVDLIDGAVEVANSLIPPAAFDGNVLRTRLERSFEAAGVLAELQRTPAFPASKRLHALRDDLDSWLAAGPETKIGVISIAILGRLDEALGEGAERLRRLSVDAILRPILDGLGVEPQRAARVSRVVRLAWRLGWGVPAELPGARELRELARRWGSDAEIRPLVGPSAGNDTSGQAADLEDLVRWRTAAGLLAALAVVDGPQDRGIETVAWLEVMDRLGRLAGAAGYEADAAASGPPSAPDPAPPASTVSE